MDSSDKQRKREESRNKQIQSVNKGLRKLDVYKQGETVHLQDPEGKWTEATKALSQCKHQGVDTLSYLLKKCKTEKLTVRN